MGKQQKVNPHDQIVNYYSDKYYDGEHKEEIREKLLSDEDLFNEALITIHKDEYSDVDLEKFKTKYKEKYGDPFAEKKKPTPKEPTKEPSLIVEDPGPLSSDGLQLDSSKDPLYQKQPIPSESTGVDPNLVGIEKAKFSEEAKIAEQQKQADLKLVDNGLSRPVSAIGTFNQMVYNIPADILDAFSIGANQIGRATEAMGLGERQAVKDQFASQMAEKYRQFIKELTPNNPAYAGELQEDVAGAAGNLMGLVMTGGITTEAKVAANLLNETAKLNRSANLLSTAISEGKAAFATPPALLGSIQTGVSEFQNAKKAGATDDEAFGVFIKNSLAGGALEAIPVLHFFKRLDQVSGGGVKQVIKNGTVQGIEEMTTEVAQNVFTNVTAADTYDKSREWYDGMKKDGGIGFGLGFVMGAMGTSLRKKQAEAKTPEERAEIQKAIDFIAEKQAELQTKTAEVEKLHEQSQAEQQPAGQESVPVEEQQAGPVQVEPGSDIVSQQQEPVGGELDTQVDQGGEVIPQPVQEQVPEQQEQVPAEVQAQPTVQEQSQGKVVTALTDKQVDKVKEKERKERRTAVLKNERLSPTSMVRGWILEGNKLRGEQSAENKQNNPSIGKGIMEETGMGKREMGQLIGIIDNKNGPSIEEAAHKIWERLDDNLKEKFDTQDIRNAFNDVLLNESREDWISNQENETSNDFQEAHNQWHYGQMSDNERAEHDDYVQSEAYKADLENNITKLAQEYDEYIKSNEYKEYANDRTRKSRENASVQENEGDSSKERSETGTIGERNREIQGSVEKYGDKSKSSEETVKELGGLNLTHVAGLNMGSNQTTGTYISTEAENRYNNPLSDGKLYNVKVNINTPLRLNSINDFVEIQRSVIEKNFPEAEGSVDNLSDSQFNELTGLVTKELKELGYDSVYFPESENQEGELVVFDRANVKLTEPDATKEGEITDSNQPERIGTGEVRETTEPGSSDSPGQGGKIPPTESKSEGKGENKKKGVKSVYRNVIVKSTLSDDLKTRLKADPYYNVLTNKESAELADLFIKEFDSAEEAANSILAVNTDVPMQGAVKCKVIAAGITELTNKFNKESDPIAQEDLTDRQSFLIDAIDNLVRDAGQTIESIKSLYKATELGIKKAVQRKIKKYNDQMSLNLGLSNVTEESFSQTFENAAEATANDKLIAQLQQEIIELKKDLEKARAERKEKQKAETAAKKKVITDRLEKNKTKFKKIDWLSKGDVAMGAIIPIPLNPEKIKALATLAKDYIELGAVNASEVYTKLNEYIKEVTDGKGFLNEKDFAVIYDQAEKSADKSLGKDINKELKEQDIKLAELAREYYTDQENIGKSIKDELVNKLGLTGKQAEVIGAKIDKIFKEKLHAEQMEQLSKKYSSKIPILTNTKKKTETLAKKLLNEINLGTLNFDVYEQLFAERHQLISYNKQSKAIIDGIVKRINNSATGTLKNRAEVELLDYIVSLQKKSLYKLGISYMYANMLSSYQTHLNNSVFGGLALTKQFVKRLAIPTQKNRTAILIAMRAMNQAVLEARDILRTGYREQGTDYVQQSDALIKGNNFLKGLSMAFRGLAAEDAFFNTPLTNMLEFEEMVNMRMRDEKYKQSKDKNYKPISTKEIVEDVNKQFEWSVKNNKVQEQAANDVLANKGLTEPLFKTRLVDYTDNNGNPQTKEVLVRNPHYADKKYNNLYRLQKLRSFEILEQERDLNEGYQKQRDNWAINQVNQEREATAKEKEKEYKPAEKIEDLTPKERQNYAEILGDHSGARQEAKMWANDQLLMGTPRGDLGILSRYLNTTIGPDYPGLKMIVIPFVNVPFNSANYLIETSPIGTITLGGKYIHHLITGKPMNESTVEHILGEGTASARLGLDNKMTDKRKRQLINRQAMFYGGITMAWMLTQLEYEEEDENGKKTKRPLLQITANGKGNWFKNEQLKQGSGEYKEWTADFMGFQFSYRYSPFGGILAPLGMLSDYEKYGKKSTEAEVSIGKKIALISMSYGEFIVEAASIKGLSDLFSLGSTDSGKSDISETTVDKAMKGTGKWMAKQAQKLVPASGLLKALNEDIAGIVGADDKQASEWYEYFMRDIPGLDIMLTTKKDHLGRPIKSITDVPVIWNGNFKKDEYYSICNEYGYENRFYWKYEITNPKNTKKSQILTQQELTELNEIRGKLAYKALFEIDQERGEGRKLDRIVKLAKAQPTEVLRKEVFDKEMDKVFTESTRKAKIAWFNKNQ